MYRKVLVAIGGSPWSDAALSYAISLAAATGADLTILTVLASPVAYTMPDVMSSSELLMESIERQGHELIAQASARAEAAEVPYSAVAKWGSVPETILQTAQEEQCDLIVLGSRVVTGWKRLMIGRTLNAVTARCEQPLLVIKHPLAVELGQPTWRRLLVATGGSPWSDMAVDHALKLAQENRLDVCLLCVDSSRAAAGDPLDDNSGAKDILANAEARAAAAGVTYEAHLAYGDVTEAVLETASSRQCDAIVMGSRGMTGLKRLMIGSISNAVAAKSLLPVMIVKRFLVT
jgi:nucleotide-binding universal stress UspA family protein